MRLTKKQHEHIAKTLIDIGKWMIITGFITQFIATVKISNETSVIFLFLGLILILAGITVDKGD